MKAQMERGDVKAEAQAKAKAFENGLRTAHVVRIARANHYVVQSNEADVLREMDAFIGGLKKVLQGAVPWRQLAGGPALVVEVEHLVVCSLFCFSAQAGFTGHARVSPVAIGLLRHPPGMGDGFVITAASGSGSQSGSTRRGAHHRMWLNY